MICRPLAACLLAAGLVAAPAAAQDSRTAPLSDTEDAALGAVAVGGGRLHAVIGVDVRNGDFVRGSYDDDAAGLGRLPVHAQFGLVHELARDAGGEATGWLMLRSSNGFHAPVAEERAAPRSWYESNTLVGVAARLAPGLTGAATYTIKASPNGVAATTHEASAALALDRDGGLGVLKPGLAATWRAKGDGGVYTQATIEPGWDLGAGDHTPRLSIPAAIGIGWGGFYEPGSGSRAYGSAGLAIEAPLAIGGGRWTARAELLALVRDDRLRALGGTRADHGVVAPYATLGLTFIY